MQDMGFASIVEIVENGNWFINNRCFPLIQELDMLRERKTWYKLW